jgi:hypothetical protein
MHAAICCYENVVGPIDEVTRAGRALTALLSQAPGFISYAVLDSGCAALTSISVFETQAELEQGNRMVARWVAEHLAVALPHPPRITSGEVILQRGI